MPIQRLRAVRLLAVSGMLAIGACRERAPAATDSSLAQDLAMAQRTDVMPTVFNDAPLGGSAASAPQRAAPTPKPEPPRARTPTPTPVPRRQQPPAPVARTPQPAPQQPVVAAPAPTPAPASAPAAGIIGAGTRVGMSTNSRVCTANVLVGDKFTATVTSGITGSNGASIPPGATVVLEVAAVDRADPVENSRIEFRVRAIDVNGEARPAAGDVATLGTLETVHASSGNDAQKVIGGAVAGAVLGRILGRSTKSTVIGAAAGAAAGTAAARRSQSSDACLPEGSSLRLTLSRDIVVQRSPI